MHSNSFFCSLFILITLSFSSCKKKGCTDPIAINYSAAAEKDNGSCNYAISSQKINYGADAIQQMQLYLPPTYDENTKVILMVHGGGWVVGYNESSKVTTFDGRYGWNILNPLLSEGYACAVMKYRTACYAEDPTESAMNTNLYLDQMMEDIDLAIAKLKDEAASIGISDNHYQLLGESAGGHIVLAYAIRNTSDPDLVSAVSMFGPTALDDAEWKIGLHELDSTYPEGILVDGINYFRTKSNACNLETNKSLSVLKELRSFGDHDTVKVYEENAYLQALSPATVANIKKETPIFIMHGEDDALVPFSQANLMHEAFLSKFPTTVVSESGAYDGTLKTVVYENCGHGWTGGGCQKSIIMSDIVKWMNAH